MTTRSYAYPQHDGPGADQLLLVSPQAPALAPGVSVRRLATLSDLACKADAARGLVCHAGELDPHIAELLCQPALAGLDLVLIVGPDEAEEAGLLLERPLTLVAADDASALDEAVRALVRGSGFAAERGRSYDEGQGPMALYQSAQQAARRLLDAARPVTAARIRAHVRARRMREQLLPADLFADPAWDMLLDLTAARLEGQRVSVSSLCIAAAVPTTTALRWIRTLVSRGFLVRTPDPADARRSFLDIAESAAPLVDTTIEAVLNHPGQ